ncbi:methyltransferase [Amycolatopsis sp. FDAARGOS 1241]|uniref:methyltransferase n=1 Tax=Amycolatopsis sp. FDAARGOS 1241 TaxID=2778070 RepID=UPI00194F5959|nr:methyltransferase [Amycolatopsis sp. FDAARGOS 1241]QRP49687.1 methyltransferase [Amycolatopsis sp. FDAARGOS 1241]
MTTVPTEAAAAAGRTTLREVLPVFPSGRALPARGLLRLPGVYRPQADTCLLASAVRRSGVPAGARALDLCAGTGALALTLARAGAASVLAVDRSRRALLSAGLNAGLRGLPVRVRRGDLLAAAAGGPYDVVVANPPYVPCPPSAGPADRRVDAGPDGRSVLDPLCEGAGALVAPGGFLLLVQSTMADVDRSAALLAAGGLRPRVVARAAVPFGPVLSGRTDFLEQRGFVAPQQREEELVVLRADR